MRNYCERYGENIYNITESFRPPAKWEGETAAKINAEMESVVPPSDLVERRRWRDVRLAALASYKKTMPAQD